MDMRSRCKKALDFFNLVRRSGSSSSIDLRHILQPPLPLPNGISEADLLDFLLSVRPADAPEEEMRGYVTQDFRRFVYTLGLVRCKADHDSGNCLEMGSNPYFTTMLLKTYTMLDLRLSNYFGEHEQNKICSQTVTYRDFNSKSEKLEELTYDHFNIDGSVFPYEDNCFDYVLFCEIIEHLVKDPLHALLEIKRVLKQDGVLILTTPNVARLENVARIISGSNIYDPYSGYGVYGRHNREYNRHELKMLLDYCGFDIEVTFTADVHENGASHYVPLDDLLMFLQQVPNRIFDLGQYIFIRAVNSRPYRSKKKPAFLFRSYPVEEMQQV